MQNRDRVRYLLGAAFAGALPASANALKPLKVGFVYALPAGAAGSSDAPDGARAAMLDHFGGKVVAQVMADVPDGRDALPALLHLAQEGNRLIYATSFGMTHAAMRVARQFPGVKFECAMGHGIAPNVGTYDARSYEGAYMAGVLAGGMSKASVLGVVASEPMPEALRDINSFALGAQSVNPAVRIKVVWINKQFDPPKETEAATSLIKAGVDVLFQNTVSPVVVQIAEKFGKYAIGWGGNMTRFGPKAHLGSVVFNWTPVYLRQTGAALAGTWTSEQIWWGLRHGVVDLLAVSAAVPEQLRARVDGVRAGLANGSFHVWQGPIIAQNGATVLAAGTIADDRFLRDMHFYVRGVDGKYPSL